MPEPIEVRKVPIQHVSDASGLAELIDAGVIEADRVIAVIGKTEGNGGVNDYTRIIADRAFREVLVARGTRRGRGRAGARSSGPAAPTACSRRTRPSSRRCRTAGRTDEPRLTVGFAMSEPLLPEEIGRRPMIEKVAAAVRGRWRRPASPTPPTSTMSRRRRRC